jgi:hypothetical protein
MESLFYHLWGGQVNRLLLTVSHGRCDIIPDHSIQTTEFSDKSSHVHREQSWFL